MKDVIITLCLLGFVTLGVVKCTQSDWYQHSERATAEEHKREATPHVVREADGCKVYAWKDSGGTGTTHYFTRCPNAAVTTERNYTVNCGKNCTRHETETNVTETK
jgi:hypothetical protein